MAHFVDFVGENPLLAWNLCFRSGVQMPLNLRKGRQQPDDPAMNSKGYFTTVDGIPVRKIFISNLFKNVQDKDLYNLFSCYGQIIEVSVAKNIGPKPTTFGFVTFKKPEEATRALRNKSRAFFKHRKLYLSPADSWHQPLELPNGELDLRRREDHKNTSPEEEADTEDADVSNNIVKLQPDDSCAISKLNDDCLLLIFNCIPMNERLSLHLVCQRWHSVLASMWFKIKKLDFTVPPLSETVLTDNLLLEYLTLCPNVTSINIATDDHKLTSKSLVHISKHCPNLEELAIRELNIKRRTLAFLARACPNLKAFYNDICTSIPDSEMVGFLKYSKNLEKIGVKFSPSPSGFWLKHIRSPLKSLSLEMYDFHPEHLFLGIANSKDTLRELKFISCDSIRSKDIETIVKLLPELTQLTLAGGYSDFMPRSLLPIAKLKKLTRLDLDNNCFVCDQLIEELSENCSELQTLTLSGSDDRHLTLQGLGHIAKMSGLTYLTLAGIRKLPDSILKSISQKIKGLKHLGVMGCTSVTDEGCQSVVTNCKDLETFDVSGCASVTNLTIIAAAESTRGTGRKLKIIAGDSGIDMDIACPPSVILDPSSSIMSQYPSTMFILDSELDFENDAFFNNLYGLNICEDLLDEYTSDDDSDYDGFGLYRHHYDYDDDDSEDDHFFLF